MGRTETLVKGLLGPPEVIGPQECPILHRWTLLGRPMGMTGQGSRFKLLLHCFTPNADDRAMHDHPRSFLTIVLAGGYVDVGPGGRRDELLPGSIRFRSATHIHRTRASSAGAWTLVVMGPLVREWGFWRRVDGGRFEWWPWRKHREAFGPGMRCP